jgi:hypothetical protein
MNKDNNIIAYFDITLDILIDELGVSFDDITDKDIENWFNEKLGGDLISTNYEMTVDGIDDGDTGNNIITYISGQISINTEELPADYMDEDVEEIILTELPLNGDDNYGFEFKITGYDYPEGVGLDDSSNETYLEDEDEEDIDSNKLVRESLNEK